MPNTLTLVESITVNGRPVTRNLVSNGDNLQQISVDLPAAKAGTLGVRTDNTTGTLTMNTGHGITTGATIDLYWTGGQRRNVTVGTVSGNSVPISAGQGDNLPAAATAITAMVQDSETASVSTGQLTGYVIEGPPAGVQGAVHIYDSGGAFVVSTKLDGTAANNNYVWTDQMGVDLGLGSSTIGSIRITHSDSANVRTTRVALLYN